MQGNTLGERLRELRMQKGVTQKVFADALNVSSSAVSKWENGQNEPDMETLREIVRYYGISIEALLEGGSEMTEDKIEEPDSKTEDADSKNILSHKKARKKWMGVGVALGFTVTVVLVAMGIIFWQVWQRNKSAFSYEIVAGRYAEDADWGEIYEVSIFYSGEFLKEHEDEVINDIMARWVKGELCNAEIETIKVLLNDDREFAENFEAAYFTFTVYFFPYNMEYSNY